MKTTIAILTLSVATALAQKPAPAAATRPSAQPPQRPAIQRPLPSAQPGQPGQPKPEPDLLDMTPTRVKFAEDGLFMPKIALLSKKGRVLISEPSYFKLTEGAKTPTFVSTEDRSATIHILSSTSPVLPLDKEDRAKAVRESVIASAPKDADRVEIVSEGENPFPINGWQTHQFTLSYGLFGQTFKKKVVFIRLHQYQELQFIAHAPDALFEKAAAGIGSILHSWYREPLNLVAGAGQPKVERD
jgi:hypothetical protein